MPVCLFQQGICKHFKPVQHVAAMIVIATGYNEAYAAVGRHRMTSNSSA
jgi:hypothetical protein